MDWHANGLFVEGIMCKAVSLLESRCSLTPSSTVNPAVTLKCGHRFHLQCIYAWLERSETCPLCGAQTSFDEIL